MNNFSYQDILKGYDDAKHWEYPPTFDWDLAFRRFDEIEKRLKVIININFSESREAIQDASYHGCIGINSKDKSSAFIRFSNFGNMVSINNPEAINSDDFKKVLDLLKEFDYLYIPLLELNRKYDGKLKKFEGTWFTRFFDYM